LFYAASNLIYFALLITTLVVSYQLTLRVRPGGPKWPVVIGIVLLFGSLAFFKYSGFLHENANDALVAVDLPSLLRFGGVILPLGISFYTFQVVAYMVDLYKGKAEHSGGFIRYLVFIMFFGQLIAGPIMRGSEYLGQLMTLKGTSWPDVQTGMFLILMGLVKKVVIADSLTDLMDTRFAAAASISQADA